MSTEGGDGQPRVRDVDLAAWLGFGQPRDIRKIIRGMTKRKLRGVHVRAAGARTSMPRGGSREIVVEEFWLTKVQALLVATQCGTARAWELTEAMAALFVAVLEAIDPRVPTSRLSAAEATIARLEGRIAEQDRAVTCGTIGPAGSKAIRRRISIITEWITGLRRGREYNRVWSSVQRELAVAAGVSRKWAQVSEGRRADVYGALDDRERSARRIAAARGRAMQIPLPLH